MVGARALATSLAAVVAAGCGAQPASPTWSIDSARMLFTAHRGDTTDLYIWSAADGAIERLPTLQAPSNFGRPAPDGQRVAFQGRPTREATDIFLINLDGTDLRNLTDDPGYDVLPSWSPDGRQLAFMSTRGFIPGEEHPFPGHIYVVNPDGSGFRQVTKERLTSSLGPQDWTRDGQHLLVSREVGGQLDLFMVDVESGGETRLTSDPASEYGASVSPDGKRLAFHAETDDDSQIVVMNLDGSDRRVLTRGGGRRYGPRWSPDGTWLVFSAEGQGGGQYDVFALEVATGIERVIVATPEDEREPDWMSGAAAVLPGTLPAGAGGR
jgi:TolB protein